MYKIFLMSFLSLAACGGSSNSLNISYVAQNYCGDGVCDLNSESCSSCPKDCGFCKDNPPTPQNSDCGTDMSVDGSVLDMNGVDFSSQDGMVDGGTDMLSDLGTDKSSEKYFNCLDKCKDVKDSELKSDICYNKYKTCNSVCVKSKKKDDYESCEVICLDQFSDCLYKIEAEYYDCSDKCFDKYLK